MSAVLKIERQQTALSLVRIGLRLSYIAAITGLNDRFLRKVWKEVHGRSPASGTSYTSTDTGLKTYSMSRQSAAFAQVYMATAATEHAKVSMHAPTFLSAWMTYTELGINADLTPDLAWQVIRNITGKNTQLKTCGQCESSYISYEKLNGKDCKCPFCYDADKRARAASLAPKKTKTTDRAARPAAALAPLAQR